MNCLTLLTGLASAAMLTEPLNDQHITKPKPTIKANLASMGDVDPKSVEMRISGFGLVPAVYDPKTKLVTYAFTQKLLPKMYTVILTAKVNGKKLSDRLHDLSEHPQVVSPQISDAALSYFRSDFARSVQNDHTARTPKDAETSDTVVRTSQALLSLDGGEARDAILLRTASAGRSSNLELAARRVWSNLAAELCERVGIARGE
jgi:hypothetical protein